MAARAIQPIDIGGVRAFNPGDLVPAEVVENHGLAEAVSDDADKAAAAAADWHANEVAPTFARQTPQDLAREQLRAARAVEQKPAGDKPPADDTKPAAKGR